MIKNKDLTPGRTTVATKERVLTIREVSETYGVKIGTLKCWRHRNSGPKSFLRGGRVVYREVDVKAWFQAEEDASTRGQIASRPAKLRTA